VDRIEGVTTIVDVAPSFFPYEERYTKARTFGIIDRRIEAIR